MCGKDKLTKIHSYWIKFIWYPASYFYENDNAKDMIDYFNSLGETLEVIDKDGTGNCEYLTEESFFKLINNPKRSLQAHRGSYKTTAIDTIGCILRLLLEPDIRICLVRKNFTKASEILYTVKQGLLLPEVKQIFLLSHGFAPKAITSRDDMLVYNFKKTITPEGNVNAYGVHQDKTGKHFDFILADDFVTIDDKISKAEREKTKAQIEEMMNNILDPGKQMGCVGTPWHKNDAWNGCPITLKFDVSMLDILNDEQVKEKQKSMSPIAYSANYELRHRASDETLFKDPTYLRWIAYIDSGIGHLDKAFFGDDTNAVTFCAKKPNGRYQVLGKVWKDHIKYHYADIAKLWKKYKIGKMYVENNDDKQEATEDYLMREGISKVEMYHESLNKHVKINSYILENGFWDLIDFDPETDKLYMEQLLDYVEGNKPCDCPDSLACIGRILIGKTADKKYTNMFKHM